VQEADAAQVTLGSRNPPETQRTAGGGGRSILGPLYPPRDGTHAHACLGPGAGHRVRG
jgi:hypothetical protein